MLFDCSDHNQHGAFGALLVHFLGDRRLGLAAHDVAWHAISSEAAAERLFAQVAADMAQYLADLEPGADAARDEAAGDEAGQIAAVRLDARRTLAVLNDALIKASVVAAVRRGALTPLRAARLAGAGLTTVRRWVQTAP